MSSKITAQYTLSEILFAMNPCHEATVWIEKEMHFETFAEAIESCPYQSWLSWVAGCVSATLWNDLRVAVVTKTTPPVLTAREFFLRPENLERFADALIAFAKDKGLKPRHCTRPRR